MDAALTCRALAIFEEALETTDADRDAYLANACAGDAPLLEVAQTGCGAGLVTGLCKDWEEDCCENRNDCDHDEQFNQCECFFHDFPSSRI